MRNKLNSKDKEMKRWQGEKKRDRPGKRKRDWPERRGILKKLARKRE